MNLIFKNKRISGVLAVVPSNEVCFDDEVLNYDFPVDTSVKLKHIMGYGKRRVVNGDICSSDLCVHGMTYLFENGLLDKNEIDALVLVTQTPDYILPPTSNIIQGKLGLKEDMICMDINQGCAGYLLGLIESFLLLEQPSIRKVVLLNADVISKKVSCQDRNSHPLIGDAASVTIVERTEEDTTIYATIKMNGGNAFAVHIPAGGCRRPSSPETAQLFADESGNRRSLDHLVMNGGEVFLFVQKQVPPMICSLLEFAGQSKESIDYFLFHQPNRFMLVKLAEKLGIPMEKMPCNVVERFGNSSGATIPVAMTYNLGDRLTRESLNVCLAGFGVGLTWASMILQMGNMRFNHLIEY